jgi:hypothetical protein
MEETKDMEMDLIELLATLIRGEGVEHPNKNFSADSTCATDLGKWIFECDYPILMETLALSNEVFAQEFPRVRLIREERIKFAGTLKAHCESCSYCRAKRDEDLAWQSRVEKAFAENTEAIGKVLARAAGKG